jgi:hypothetical protein
MTRESLSNAEWLRTIDRLGGTELLEKEAREFGAFERARKIKCAVDQLRLALAYCSPRPRQPAETARPAFEPRNSPPNCGLFVGDLETPVRIGLDNLPSFHQFLFFDLTRISHTPCGLRCSFGVADAASGGERVSGYTVEPPDAADARRKATRRAG